MCGAGYGHGGSSGSHQRLRRGDLAPSNPFVSIGCILAVEPIRNLLRRKDNGPVVAISPIVGGEAIKGPAARMFAQLGMEPSALAVARLYEDFLDGFVMDIRGLPRRVRNGLEG